VSCDWLSILVDWAMSDFIEGISFNGNLLGQLVLLINEYLWGLFLSSGDLITLLELKVGDINWSIILSDFGQFKTGSLSKVNWLTV